MHNVMSEEEANEYEKSKTEEIKIWFNSLSFNEKEKIYDHFYNIFKEIKCSHDFFQISYYGKLIRQCRHCEYFEENND